MVAFPWRTNRMEDEARQGSRFCYGAYGQTRRIAEIDAVGDPERLRSLVLAALTD